MSDRKYTDENDQPIEEYTDINGDDLLEGINDLLHGDVTISQAIAIVRKHPGHSHTFKTRQGFDIKVPALAPVEENPLNNAIEELMDFLASTPNPKDDK